MSTILAAMDDPQLFGPHFRGPSWAPWKAFLAAMFGLPMNEAALATYQHHTSRTEPPLAPFKEAALVIGRRGGKSRALALIAVFLACFFDYVPYLAPGEVATIAVIAADRRQARSIFRFTLGLLKAVPMLARLIESETADTITLTNRVVIEIATASFRVSRGYTFAAVLADEVAFWRNEDSAAPDEEIIAALRPGMATIPNAMLLLASSPYRRRGVLYTTFARHWGKDDARVLVWKATSLEMNATLDPRQREEAFEDDPERASSEWDAEFRSDLSDFVPREVIAACTIANRFELYPAGHRYVAFIDPSGGTGGDSMTLAIAHREGDHAILDAVREVRPPFSPEAVTIDFANVLKTYSISTVTGDRYAGDWPRERLRLQGIHYELSEHNRSEIYLNCLPILNSGRAELLALPRIAAQFCGLERRTSRGGRDSIDHAPGQHDDVANVVAGALLLAVGARQSQGARWIKNFSFMGR